MKNGKIFLALFLSAAFFGCQKESSLLSDASQPYVRAEIKFSIGEKSYTLSSVRQEANYNDKGGCADVCGDKNAQSFSEDWATYSNSGKSLSVTRQDNATDPALRLSLSGTLDLKTCDLPAKVVNAKLALSDFKGILIEKYDDPALGTGTLYFESHPDAIDLTITSKNGNVVEGTFSGILKIMPSGAAVEVRDGTFTAQLNGL